MCELIEFLDLLSGRIGQEVSCADRGAITLGHVAACEHNVGGSYVEIAPTVTAAKTRGERQRFSTATLPPLRDPEVDHYLGDDLSWEAFKRSLIKSHQDRISLEDHIGQLKVLLQRSSEWPRAACARNHRVDHLHARCCHEECSD